jgi:hypothetical protein
MVMQNGRINDTVIFINPSITKVQAIRNMLDIFGEETDLCINFDKISITHIFCENLDLSKILAMFRCQPKPFPCTYLGIFLSDLELRKADL